MSEKLLSTRIKELRKHCHHCKGKGYYEKEISSCEVFYSGTMVTVSCPDCYDLNIILRGVLKLEKENKDLMKSNHILRSTLQVANNMLSRHETKEKK